MALGKWPLLSSQGAQSSPEGTVGTGRRHRCGLRAEALCGSHLQLLEPLRRSGWALRTPVSWPLSGPSLSPHCSPQLSLPSHEMGAIGLEGPVRPARVARGCFQRNAAWRVALQRPGSLSWLLPSAEHDLRTLPLALWAFQEQRLGLCVSVPGPQQALALGGDQGLSWEGVPRDPDLL